MEVYSGTLLKANIHRDLIDLIMNCVSSTTTSVLFNEGNLDPFWPSRGIRQGDPLSPYLFILCMEVLGHLIEEKCRDKEWIPVKASRSEIAFSHLFFADDLVLFARADGSNCLAVREALDEFCTKSGQSVSESKSRVFFSPNVDRDTREALCDILGFSSTPNLGKYLGFPIRHQRSSSQDFNFVLERVKQKLAGWKANLLSLAGRIVLVQASSSTIPTYIMQCNALSGKLLDNIDRVNRNSLWGSSESVKKMHWVGWQKVTRPKSEGGLGLHTAKGRNLSLLAKLNWRFHTEKDSLWSKVLRSKYCNRQRLNARNPAKLPCSRVWSAMQKGKDTFQKGTRWVVGRNSELSFWFDNWCSDGPLRSLVQGPLPLEEEKLKVKEVVTVSGWNWSKISIPIPDNVSTKLKATPVSLAARGQDRLTWGMSTHGGFELKSAYKLAIGGGEGESSFTGQWVWKTNILPRNFCVDVLT